MSKNDGYIMSYFDSSNNFNLDKYLIDLFGQQLDTLESLIAAESDIFGFEDNLLMELIVIGDWLHNKSLMSPELYKCHNYVSNNAPISKNDINIYRSLLLAEVFYITQMNRRIRYE